MITEYSDMVKFRERVVPGILRHEAANNLILGLLGGEPAPGMLLLEVDDGVAICTPPFNLIVSELAEPSVDALVAHLVAARVALPGVLGPPGAARRLARGWVAARGGGMRLLHAMRVFENRALISPRAPVDGGQLRAASVADLAQVASFIDEFNRSVATTTPTPRAVVEERVRRGDFFFWETDRVVSMAGLARRTPNGAAVAYVYTPPQLRGRGYASALVAALTAQLHDQGKLGFLFADAANPTANKIYQAIGYRAVADVEEWRFDRE